MDESRDDARGSNLENGGKKRKKKATHSTHLGSRGDELLDSLQEEWDTRSQGLLPPRLP